LLCEYIEPSSLLYIYILFLLSLSLSLSLSRCPSLLPLPDFPSLSPPSVLLTISQTSLLSLDVPVGFSRGLGFSPSTTYTHAPMLAHTHTFSFSLFDSQCDSARTHTQTHTHIARSLALSRAHSRSLSPNSCRHPRGIREHINNMMKTF